MEPNPLVARPNPGVVAAVGAEEDAFLVTNPRQQVHVAMKMAGAVDDVNALVTKDVERTREVGCEWEIPPKFLGGVPDVAPGSSAGKVVQGDFPLDQVVIDKLPPGTVVLTCNRYGGSEWTVAARINTTLANGESKSYFLKCAEYDQGRIMVEGEFQSMAALHKVAPDFVPEPHAWGQLTVASGPDTYFLLVDFIEFESDRDPDPVQLCRKLVALHRSSASPTGMFGFHVKPLRGSMPLETTWNPSWSDFFCQLFRRSLALDRKVNGPQVELGQLVELAIAHAVPLILGPLEADGRVVKPSLIHGDLWDGNIATDTHTNEIYIFDASSYYAHHEMEIAIWRPIADTGCIVYSGACVREYNSQMGISEPAAQFEDRQKLYSACTAMHAAACHNGDHFRRETREKLRYLLGKYAKEVELPEPEGKEGEGEGE